MHFSASKILSKLPASSRNLVGFVGGALFTLIFYISYQSLDKNWFDTRDDGVITMSVGKNLVEHGFIGVSPSGPIVEASSSPVQTALYALSYAITGIDYETFTHLQTYLFTFLIGYLFARFFSAKPSISLLLSALGAYALTTFYTFFAWHASGMENAATHFLFLATIYIFHISIRDEKINYWMAMVVFLATVTRLDSIYHISLLLLAYSIFWFLFYKNLKALYFSTIVFCFWLSFNIFRYYYFGDYLPNTAYAQGISVTDRMKMLINLDKNYISSSIILSKEILIKNGGLLLSAVLPLFIFFNYSRKNLFFAAVLLLLILTSAFNPFIFGKTRLDQGRSTTQMALLVIFLIGFLIYNSKNIKASITALALAFPAYALLDYKYQYNPYYLCCSTKDFGRVNDRFMALARANEINRPTISNPDLGLMTWRKNINVIDLGMLGSPIMAKLKNGPVLAEYYLNYAKPDFIEAHGVWIRRYCDALFTDVRFEELYTQVDTSYDLKEICTSTDVPPKIFWIRKDIEKNSLSKERLFLDEFQNSLSLERIAIELDNCAENEDCTYIARTVYKLIPELRDRNIIKDVYDLFGNRADRALLSGWHDGQAGNAIIDDVKRKMITSEKGKLVITGKWDIYLSDSTLVYYKENCKKSDYQDRFYLHFIPKDKRSLPDHGFINLDFSFEDRGLTYKDKCLAKQTLPSSQIEKINTGQFSVLEQDGKRKFVNHWNSSFVAAPK